jgi:hypothetical protein
MRKGIILIVFTAFLFQLLISSCHSNFCKWDFGYNQLSQLPVDDSIIGTYYLTLQSKEYLKNQGLNRDCELVLMKSDHFRVTNLPVQANDSSTSQWSYLSKNGIWSVTCMDSSYCMIELEKIAVLPIARKGDGKISILMTLGDGDLCNGIIFERK